MDKIPLFKVFMAEGISKVLDPILHSGYIGQGPQVEKFEEKLNEYLGGAGILTMNSCTSALELAGHLIGVGPGDEVITTPQTCTATNGWITHAGATIVWADVDPVSGHIDPVDVAKKITHKTKAIVAVDWGGAPCDYDALRLIAWRDHLRVQIPIIEDAAHAFGAQYGEESIAQSGGDYICWSFQAIKSLTTGDGGALQVPKDQRERAKLLRWFGFDRTKNESFRCSQRLEEIGFKYHMNDIAATIGLHNLECMDWVLERHQENADFYRRHMANKDISLHWEDTEENLSSWWIYTMLVEDRASFQTHMHALGIDTSEVHSRNDKHGGFQRATKCAYALPGLDKFSAQQVSIPVGWWLSKDDRNRVVDAVNSWTR